MNIDDIKTLASLSRLELSQSEQESYVSDFDGILNYIDMLQEVSGVEMTGQSYNPITNVMREDDIAYAPGEFSEALLNEAPKTQDGFVKVKKIL